MRTVKEVELQARVNELKAKSEHAGCDYCICENCSKKDVELLRLREFVGKVRKKLDESDYRDYVFMDVSEVQTLQVKEVKKPEMPLPYIQQSHVKV